MAGEVKDAVIGETIGIDPRDITSVLKNKRNALNLNAPSGLAQNSDGLYRWQTPGSRVVARANSLSDELGLGVDGFAGLGGKTVRQLEAHELLALSERHGREYALIGFRDGTWRLFSGTADEVASIGAHPSIIRRMHTHPGIGKGAAFPSGADASAHLIHRQGGGKGALEVISRLENGGTFTWQWNYSQAKTFLDDLEDFMKILSWGN